MNKNDEKLEAILAMNITPGLKIYIITLYYYGEDMTTSEMNSYLNKNLTYKNLEAAFSDLIDKCIIEKTEKIINGVKRKSFKLNLSLIYNFKSSTNGDTLKLST